MTIIPEKKSRPSNRLFYSARQSLFCGTIRMQMKLLISLLFTFLILIGCSSRSSNESVLNKIKLKDLYDQSIDLDKYEGKTIFINFWATWCAPCIKEMPSIEKAMTALEKDKIVFLFASNESVEQIKEFDEEKKFNFTYVQLQNMEELNIQVLPTTYIINSKGELAFSETGFRQWDEAANLELINRIIHGSK